MTTYLYIDKSGTVRGSLVAPPEKPEHTKENRSDLREYFRDPNDNLQAEKEYYTALQKWKESCLEFEDQEQVKGKLWTECGYTAFEDRSNDHGIQGEIRIKPNSILSLDLEVEEVRQYLATGTLWVDYNPSTSPDVHITFITRTVYRFLEAKAPLILPTKSPRGMCQCLPKDQHGETSVMCCNHCGMPTEDFWKVTPAKTQEELIQQIATIIEHERKPMRTILSKFTIHRNHATK